MLRTTNAAGRIRDESLMNLGGRGNDIKKIKCTLMKCHTNDNSTSSTQLPHKFSYIVAILGHNHFESPNKLFKEYNIR
jgi:hypothetical protein